VSAGLCAGLCATEEGANESIKYVSTLDITFLAESCYLADNHSEPFSESLGHLTVLTERVLHYPKDILLKGEVEILNLVSDGLLECVVEPVLERAAYASQCVFHGHAACYDCMYCVSY